MGERVTGIPSGQGEVSRTHSDKVTNSIGLPWELIYASNQPEDGSSLAEGGAWAQGSGHYSASKQVLS